MMSSLGGYRLSLQVLSPVRKLSPHLDLLHIQQWKSITRRTSGIFHRSLCSKTEKSIDDFNTQDVHNAKDSADDFKDSNIEDLLRNSTARDTDTASHHYEQKYQNYQAWKRDQTKHAFRPKVDPKDTSVMLFPGQGAQFVGMGSDLLKYPLVEDMYSVASDILGYDLLELCLRGPKQELEKTVHCQPAILVTSLAAVEKLKAINPKAIEQCITTAGFSVGEYAALVFSGAISFEDAVKVVKVRAEAMQRASSETPSGMTSVFLSHKSKLNFAMHAARRYCSERLDLEHPVCIVASYLYPECKVVAGNIEALEFLEQNCKDFGIRRTKRLPVSGAFHTSLMRPAKKSLEDALKDVYFRRPIVPVHSNVTSFKYGRPASIRDLLLEQLYKPVKWEQTMHVLYSRHPGRDFPRTYEMGPGGQLGSLVNKVNAKAHEHYENITV